MSTRACWSARLADAVAAHRVPGASLAIRDGEETMLAVAGVTDVRSGAPVTADTVFRLGSITKAFTAALVMRQVSAGRVDLDRPVRALLPELVLGDMAAAAIVTPRQLLSHSGGFFGDVLDGPSEGEDALAAYVAAGSRLTQVTPPGAAFSYCNAGFAIAGRLVEVAGGDGWDRLFADQIARPLGMTRTGARLEAMPADDVATSHMQGAAGEAVPLARETTGRAMAPAGATAWSTPRDTLYLADLLNGDRPHLLAPAAAAEMRALYIAGPTPTFATGWGLGVQRFTADGRTFGHDGAVAGQNSFLRIVPAERLTFALFCNGGDARGLFGALWAALEADRGRPLADALPKWPGCTRVDDPGYAGRYGVPGQVVEVLGSGDGLIARTSAPAGSPDPAAPVELSLRPQPDNPTGELFLTRPPHSRLPVQQRFTRDLGGRRLLLFRGRLLPEIA